MQNFSMLIQGFGTALTPMNIGVCMLGAILGLVVGAMPGIGSLAGVALLLPLTTNLIRRQLLSCWVPCTIPICTAEASAQFF